MLLFIESVANESLCIILISGFIITTIPLALFFAWISGPYVYQAVFLFTSFVIIIITLHIMELCFS